MDKYNVVDSEAAVGVANEYNKASEKFNVLAQNIKSMQSSIEELDGTARLNEVASKYYGELAESVTAIGQRFEEVGKSLIAVVNAAQNVNQNVDNGAFLNAIRG